MYAVGRDSWIRDIEVDDEDCGRGVVGDGDSHVFLQVYRSGAEIRDQYESDAEVLYVFHAVGDCDVSCCRPRP